MVLTMKKWGLSIVKLVYRRNVQVNLFLTKKICPPFFSCTRALSYALLWLLQSGVYVFPSKSNWKKKTAGQVSKQKRKEMRGLFLVAKAKWSLAWTGFFSVNRSNKRYPHSVFIAKGFILQHKIQVYTAKTRTELFRKSVWKTTSFRKNNLQPWTSLDF